MKALEVSADFILAALVNADLQLICHTFFPVFTVPQQSLPAFSQEKKKLDVTAMLFYLVFNFSLSSKAQITAAFVLGND